MAILMSWSVEQTLGDRFTATRDLLKRLFPKWSLGKSYTGWYTAQAHWLKTLQPALTQRMQKHMQRLAGNYWTREGWCAFAADGSRVECPRTKANEKGLGCAGRNKTGPQLFVTTLWHMGTGLPWDFRVGPGTSSERRHLEDMLAGLPRTSLIVADAGFTGYELFRRTIAAGQAFLVRVGANVHLLRKLGWTVEERDDTVYLWPDQQRSQPPVVLRLITRQQGKKRMCLVTNVLDKKRLSEKSAGVLYEMRWGIEVFYRSTKQTLQKRRMLSRTPQAAQCEWTWAMFGIWMLGLMSVSAILQRGHDPLVWSVALARTRVRQTLRLALTDRPCRRSLSDDLGTATKDSYERTHRKKARNWPHKKKEAPPGLPNILLANDAQKRAAARLKVITMAG
jgi:hypothetical protein